MNKTEKPTVALCLSGGGFRAIAFQLGCMRALYRKGVLDKVNIISAVSGGSIIGAMYAYGDDSFGEFEKRVTALLRRGIAGSLFRRAFFSYRLVGSVITFMGASLAAFAADIFRTVLAFFVRKLGKYSWQDKPSFMHKLQPPFRRWTSRSSSFEDILRLTLFGKQKLSDKRRNCVDIVLNSCELRTGEPFRFSNRQSGCRRFGGLKDNCIEVAHAVAASAAYPIFFPAIDRYYVFGNTDYARRERVFLVDGGVYDNLGTASVLPERMPLDDFIIFPASYIICCTAGQGEKKSLPHWLVPRLIRVSDVISKKFLHIERQALTRLKAEGKIKGFVVAYLAQDDAISGSNPESIIAKEDVQDYPTSFFPMKQQDIDLIARRGEQVMEALLKDFNLE